MTRRRKRWVFEGDITLGRMVLTLRNAHRGEQQDFAADVGVGPKRVSDWEKHDAEISSKSQARIGHLFGWEKLAATKRYLERLERIEKLHAMAEEEAEVATMAVVIEDSFAIVAEELALLGKVLRHLVERLSASDEPPSAAPEE